VIRRFHEETNLRAHILLDTSESLAFRDEGSVSKLDCACSLAAGLMFILVNQGDTVGLTTFDNRMQTVFEPVGTFDGLKPMLLGLEALRPAGESDIEAVLHQVAGVVRSKSLVIVISDLLQEPDEVVRGLRHLYHDGHNIMVLHVLDHGELSLSFGGIAELRELESGAKLVVEVDEIKEAYRTAVNGYLDIIRRGCAECLAEHALIDTRLPIVEALTQVTQVGT